MLSGCCLGARSTVWRWSTLSFIGWSTGQTCWSWSSARLPADGAGQALPAALAAPLSAALLSQWGLCSPCRSSSADRLNRNSRVFECGFHFRGPQTRRIIFHHQLVHRWRYLNLLYAVNGVGIGD